MIREDGLIVAFFLGLLIALAAVVLTVRGKAHCEGKGGVYLLRAHLCLKPDAVIDE